MKFCWKVSSQANYDYLQFYIDTTLKDQISGEVDWQQKSYTVSPGIHTLKWRCIKKLKAARRDYWQRGVIIGLLL